MASPPPASLHRPIGHSSPAGGLPLSGQPLPPHQSRGLHRPIHGSARRTTSSTVGATAVPTTSSPRVSGLPPSSVPRQSSTPKLVARAHVPLSSDLVSELSLGLAPSSEPSLDSTPSLEVALRWDLGTADGLNHPRGIVASAAEMQRQGAKGNDVMNLPSQLSFALLSLLHYSRTCFCEFFLNTMHQ
jgi:hypothetical protein